MKMALLPEPRVEEVRSTESKDEVYSRRKERGEVERSWYAESVLQADPGASSRADCCQVARLEHV
jgi:hypothetical protein